MGEEILDGGVGRGILQLSPFFASIFPLFPQKRLILRLDLWVIRGEPLFFCEILHYLTIAITMATALSVWNPRRYYYYRRRFQTLVGTRPTPYHLATEPHYRFASQLKYLKLTPIMLSAPQPL